MMCPVMICPLGARTVVICFPRISGSFQQLVEDLGLAFFGDKALKVATILSRRAMTPLTSSLSEERFCFLVTSSAESDFSFSKELPSAFHQVLWLLRFLLVRNPRLKFHVPIVSLLRLARS